MWVHCVRVDNHRGTYTGGMILPNKEFNITACMYIVLTTVPEVRGGVGIAELR